MTSFRPSLDSVMARSAVLLDNWDYVNGVLSCGKRPMLLAYIDAPEHMLYIVAKLMEKAAAVTITHGVNVKGDWSYIDNHLCFKAVRVACKFDLPCDLNHIDVLIHQYGLDLILSTLNALHLS